MLFFKFLPLFFLPVANYCDYYFICNMDILIIILQSPILPAFLSAGAD